MSRDLSETPPPGTDRPTPFIEHLLLTRHIISLNPHHWEGETIITSKAIQPEVTVGIENQEYLIQGHTELFQHTSLSPLFLLLYLSPGEREEQGSLSGGGDTCTDDSKMTKEGSQVREQKVFHTDGIARAKA